MLKKGLILLAAILFSTAAFSQTSTQLKKKKDQLTREIAALNKDLKQTSGSKRLSQKQLDNLAHEIRLREEKIGTINSQIRLLDDQISTNTQTVHNLQRDLETLRKKYAEMVRFAQRNKDSYTTLMFIFSSKDFHQAFMRMKYISQFDAYRRKQAGEIQGTQQKISTKIDQLGKDKKEKNALLVDEVEEKQTLGKKKDKQAQQVKQLSAQEKKIRQQLTTRQAQLKKLDNQIQAAINREILAEKKRLEALAAARAKAEAAKAAAAAAAARKANPSAPVKSPPPVAAPKPVSSGSAVLSATPESAKLSASFAANKGRLPWPVSAGHISESFGTHTYGVDVKIYNTGIDIETSPGASVQAVFEGEVFSVTTIDSYAVVMIRHGEYITVYSHLKSASVSRGQKVSTKQTIGSVAGDQLHFEVRKGISETNPAGWIAR